MAATTPSPEKEKTVSDNYDDLKRKVERLEGQLRATQDITAYMFKLLIKKKNRLAFSKLVSKFGSSLALSQPPKFRKGYRTAVKKMSKKIVNGNT